MTPLGQINLGAVRVLDGGMATELERRGADISGPLWSARVLLNAPELIEAVHLDYLEAGADCISTASYQVSALGFAEVGMDSGRAADALRKSVRLAESARDKQQRPILIAASLGPYGAALHNGAEYHGNYDYSFEELVLFHLERLAALESTNADLIAFETVPSIEEARAMVEALRSFPGMAAWISFTCKDARHTGHGESLAECAAMLDREPQITAVGVNCTSPRWILPLIGELRDATAKPIAVYPNSGEGWNAVERSWTGQSDILDFGRLARLWAEAGAQMIGGCCRTTPAHIRAVREGLGQTPASVRQ